MGEMILSIIFPYLIYVRKIKSMTFCELFILQAIYFQHPFMLFLLQDIPGIGLQSLPFFTFLPSTTAPQTPTIGAGEFASINTWTFMALHFFFLSLSDKLISFGFRWHSFF